MEEAAALEAMMDVEEREKAPTEAEALASATKAAATVAVKEVAE